MFPGAGRNSRQGFDPGLFHSVIRKAVGAAVLACAVAASGCSTTGQNFNSMALERIIPGQTTLADAIDILGSEPQDIWRSTDGSALARWAYKGTVLTDAIYLRQEALLRFDAFGRFERMVHSVNVPARPPKRAPSVPNSYTSSSYSPAPDYYDPVSAGEPVQVVTPAWNPVRAANPLQDNSEAGIPAPAVTYPIPR